jgi:DNA-directed RNA polymerase subunit RPC12/RpoP
MLKFLKRFFNKSFEQAVQMAVKEELSKINDVSEQSLQRCHCGRKTLIKNHTKTVSEDGKVVYTFHIVCPNCGKDIYGKASKLEKAKLIAISKWNKTNGLKLLAGVQSRNVARKVGRPRKATI